MQAGQAIVLGHGLQLRQRDAALHAQAAGVDTAQKSQVRAAAQCRADVFAQGADVGAFAAGYYYFDSCLRFIRKH